MAEQRLLLQLTQAMYAAAVAGDFEQVAELLDRRQSHLETWLAQAAAEPSLYAAIREVLAQDQAIINLILREQEEVRAKLAELKARRKMRQAYLEHGREDEVL